MNPTLLKALPYALIALFAFTTAFMTHMYLTEKDEFTYYRAQGEQREKDRQALTEAAKSEGEANLEALRSKYEKDIPEIQRRAVDNYVVWLRKQSAVQPKSDANASGQPGDDDTKREPVVDPVTAEIIRNAARDAQIINEWIEYCTVNHCPTKE